MVAYAAQSIEGVDVTGIYTTYDQTAAQSATNAPEYPGAQMKLGTQVTTTDGSRWIFADTVTTITRGQCCAINSTFRATAVGGAGAATAVPEGLAMQIGFYQNSTSLTTGQSAWFIIQGNITALVASAGISVALYTLDTAGALTGATNTVSHYQISGITCVVTASGTTASLTATRWQLGIGQKAIGRFVMLIYASSCDDYFAEHGGAFINSAKKHGHQVKVDLAADFPEWREKFRCDYERVFYAYLTISETSGNAGSNGRSDAGYRFHHQSPDSDETL